MILEVILSIREVSTQKEGEKGEKYFTVLIESGLKDWDFGIRPDEARVSTEKDLSAYKGKKVKTKCHFYVSKKNEVSLSILEILS